MIPKLREIQALKYETEYVDCKNSEDDKKNNESDEYFLFQRKNSLSKLEFNFFSKDSVKTFFPGDHTHTNLAGATFNAKTVAEAIRNLKECELHVYENE